MAQDKISVMYGITVQIDTTPGEEATMAPLDAGIENLQEALNEVVNQYFFFSGEGFANNYNGHGTRVHINRPPDYWRCCAGLYFRKCTKIRVNDGSRNDNGNYTQCKYGHGKNIMSRNVLQPDGHRRSNDGRERYFG